MQSPVLENFRSDRGPDGKLGFESPGRVVQLLEVERSESISSLEEGCANSGVYLKTRFKALNTDGNVHCHNLSMYSSKKHDNYFLEEHSDKSSFLRKARKAEERERLKKR